MAGFGTSLRQSRRKGWESAYVDYENLKLLLTQIEAVYEENNNTIRNAATTSGQVGSNTSHQEGYYLTAGFDGPGYDGDVYDPVGFSQEYDELQQSKKNAKTQTVTDFRDELFLDFDSVSSDDGLLSYNNNEIFVDSNHNNTSNRGVLPPNANFSFSYDGSMGGVDSNLLVNVSGTSGYDSIDEQNPILGSSNQQRTYQKQQQQKQHQQMMMMMGGEMSGQDHKIDKQSSKWIRFGDDGIKLNRTLNLTTGGSPRIDKRSDRIKKRRPYKTRKRKKRHTRCKVPPHLRIANVKARAITERFLGLLRAEVDKVMLFANSQMGQLSDTIGSLRFPSDDQNYSGQSLSDVGMHSSSSSSSDGIRNSDGWYESEEEEEEEGDINCHEIIEEVPCNQKSHKKSFETNGSLTQQILHNEQLRISRPMFQRSDIFGEDFLLLSAVDEADAYAAVGIEMMHLLKFLCVNVITIRKISKKHDKLLRSRMLGGYYNRPSVTKVKKGNDSVQQTNLQQGLLLDLAMGIDKVSLPALKQGRLVGLYDAMIQNLANSSTALIISESLTLALSEYEVSRRRADALSGLHKGNPTLRSNGSMMSLEDEAMCIQFPHPRSFGLSSLRSVAIDKVDDVSIGREYGNPSSTSSSVSMTRLHFVVNSVLALREAARRKNNPFNCFLSRSMITLFDSSYVGEAQGMEGCSKKTLDFFANYNPDAALILHPQILQRCLDADQNTIAACLVAATDMSALSNKCAGNNFDSINIVLAKPISTTSSFFSPQKTPEKLIFRLNRFSITLCTMNYYIIFPSAASLCCSLGAKSTYSPILIGVTSVTCFISVIWHNQILFDIGSERKKCNLQMKLIQCAFLGLVGNVFYSLAYKYRSLPIAFLGRLILGFSFSELINKRIATDTSRDKVAVETAGLKKAHMKGMIFGFFFGTVFKMSSRTVYIGYSMAILWLFQIIGLLLNGEHTSPRTQHESREFFSEKQRVESSSTAEINDLKHIVLERDISQKSIVESLDLRNPTVRKIKRKQSLTNILNRKWKLICVNIALPVTMVLLLFSSITTEILFSSCAIIVHRYFKWSGSIAGLFLLSLSSIVYPIYWAAAYWSRCHDERTVVKKTLAAVMVGIMVFANYQALFVLFLDIRNIFHQEKSPYPEPAVKYDWPLGSVQYCVGVSLILMCCVALEGVSISLMSKVSPSRLNVSAFNCSAIVPLLFCQGRLIGDALLLTVAFSHRIINTDMVNSIIFIVSLLWCACIYLVRKHFFFLDGS